VKPGCSDAHFNAFGSAARALRMPGAANNDTTPDAATKPRRVNFAIISPSPNFTRLIARILGIRRRHRRQMQILCSAENHSNLAKGGTVAHFYPSFVPNMRRFEPVGPLQAPRSA
jgi:hypothetical protein